MELNGSDDPEVPERKRLREPPSLGTIIEAVSMNVGCDQQQIFESVRGQRNVARMLVVHFASTIGQLTHREAADALGMKHYSAAASSLRILKFLLEGDRLMIRLYTRIKDQIAKDATWPLFTLRPQVQKILADRVIQDSPGHRRIFCSRGVYHRNCKVAGPALNRVLRRFLPCDSARKCALEDFLENDDRQPFTYNLTRVPQRFDWAVGAWCVIENHDRLHGPDSFYKDEQALPLEIFREDLLAP